MYIMTGTQEKQVKCNTYTHTHKRSIRLYRGLIGKVDKRVQFQMVNRTYMEDKNHGRAGIFLAQAMVGWDASGREGKARNTILV